MLALGNVVLARYKLSRYLQPTPLEAAPGLGKNIWLKLENTNKTHSFKVRGALNALLSLSDEARARGIVTASSGNHAQGVAYAAHLLGVPAQIVMPAQTARRKVDGVRRWGDPTIIFTDDYDEAERTALQRSQTENLTYISPYNHPQVVAGQGTIALEILEAQPDTARVIVPVGGGGLISGIALALKALKPSIEVIGVNVAVSPDMFNFFYNETRSLSSNTLADALPGAIEDGSITFDLTRQFVDQIVLVDEAAVAAAMRWLLADAGWLVEGGGAVGVAALQSGQIAPSAEGATVIVVSGGNVDIEKVRAVLG
jgi:threonine dehydratase